MGMLLAAFRVFHQAGRPLLDVPYALALLGIATLLGRRCLMGLGVLPSPGGIEAVAPEFRLAQLVLVGCAATILLVLLLARLRVPRLWERRPTTR
jgi:hypothetical protein